MAPGVGGNGGGSRHTGTVPKTKSHNESCREYNGISRRDYQHFNHVPNNLSSLDWQPVNESLSHLRTRKESNTSASRFSESFDAGEENTVTHDNFWYNSARRSQSYASDDDEGVWQENGYKSNNLELVDKSQVATRLHQIRDYVNQTVSMMDSLRASGGQRNMAQHEKLASMLEGLRDSEVKLQSLYERLQQLPEGEPENFHSQQALEAPRERVNKPISAVPKTSETAHRNELKKRVQVTELKLQELQEQQVALKALRQKAQEQLNEARAAQVALLSAHGVNQQSANADNMIQDRLHNLQRFFDTSHQLVQLVGLDEGDHAESAEMQNKLDELQAKKQHMDQLLAQLSQLNGTEEMTAEECERDVENKMAELNAMRDTLAMLQGSMSAQLQTAQLQSAQLQTPTSQRRIVKKESRTPVEKSNAATSHAFQAKTHQLQEAKSKLQQLQTLLQTVEELRENGQPIPDSILQLMSNSDVSSSPTHQDRSDLSSQELSLPLPVSERVVNSCERSELLADRSFRSLNSSERERVNHQQPANAIKHNNQEGKLGTKMQLEELLRNQDLNLPQPLQSSSFQENSVTTGTWGGSTQDTLDDGYNPEFPGDMNESASVKNVTSGSQPHNVWRKPSTGSASRCSWTSPYVPQDTAVHHAPPSSSQPQSTPQQPDSQWVVHQINQLQSQLQQMSGLYKNFVEKQHNCPPPPPAPWLTPANVSAALGPYCQYLASASQWQQQQLLVHSLNQCCQLIWHQQRELMALKEALSLLQQSPQDLRPQQVPPDLPQPPLAQASSSSNLNRRPLKPSLSAGPSLIPPAFVASAHSLPNLTSPQTSPASPTPVNTHNRLASPLSLPPTLNNTQPNPNLFYNHNSQFTDPNFINLYPPYGNNLNFEFPSPVNFFPNPPEPFLTWATASSQPPPPTTLNNQVPPGNRANNYWDNFRSYSRQNLLSNSGKSNDGLPQRTLMERFLNTDHSAQPRDHLRTRKEQLNAQCRQMADAELSRGIHMHLESEGEIASGYQQVAELKSHVRQQAFSPHSFQHNLCNENEARSSVRLNENEVLHSARSLTGNEHEARSLHSARTINENEIRSPHSTRFVNENEIRSPHSARYVNENEPRSSHPARLINENESRSVHSARLLNENEAKSQFSARLVNENEAKSQHLARVLNENEARSLHSARLINGHEGKTTRLISENEAKSQHLIRPSNESEARSLQGARTVNDCEAPRGANKKAFAQDLSLCCERKGSVNKRNYSDLPSSGREVKISQLNNYNSEVNTEVDSGVWPINLVNTECISRPRRNQRNVNSNPEHVQNCIGDGHCLMTTEKGVRRKENKGNVSKECKTEIKSRMDCYANGDSLEECVYSEVAALISVNEWRPQFLLQLFKDLRLLSASGDPATQAALSSLHLLATTKDKHPAATVSNQVDTESPSDSSNQQPRNWILKDPAPQLPPSCAQLDWEVRIILVELLPFIKVQLAEMCGPQLLEALRKLILQLVPTQSTQDQLDAQLEDALHKFQNARLGDVYEELLTVVADVLTSELTFLRLINTVHHSSDQQNGEDAVLEREEEEEEGAVGGMVAESNTPANQPRRIKSETVSEADLAEADQSRHTNSGGEEEVGDTAEGLEQLEEASGGEMNLANCNGSAVTESKTEANWAVEQDRELGLDQVPTRLATSETEQDAHNNVGHLDPDLM